MLRKLHRNFAFHLQTSLLINNKFVNSTNRATFPAFNPTTEERIADVQLAGDNDVADAVSAARSAFDRGPWRFMSGRDRGKLLIKLADLIEKHAKDLAHVETIDNGKPIHNVMNIDIPLSVDTYRYYAGLANNIKGNTIPIHGNYACYTRKEPVGAVAQIIPWNFPILMQAWKLSHALAAGCTVILKPAEQTPLTALLIGELIVEAGFPPGVVNILTGFGETGESLVLHPDVDKIVFTGSTEIGHKIIKISEIPA
ncbi:unnamed protein product [Blepharisma stoltei]|uniref:Aldehyde dehydrogenase domain-containing protein n=1 Tax=Blepharisma stoltei TaxID=1481888 RepID=A0AAU9K668_9CILI|nr:unnamed protein product [Blepharisma stoltei]